MVDVVVTGASGRLGRRVLPLLAERGLSVAAVSRRPRTEPGGVEWGVGDTVRDEGLDAALAGARTVLHLAGGPRGDDVGTAHLVAAAARARVAHVVLISVIGADAMPIGYFRRKAAAERALRTSGVPWTVLRAAQFHEFVDGAVRGLTALPVAVAPRGLRFEPVDADEVAARLVELVVAGPSGRVPDLAGPAVLSSEQLVARWAAARGRRLRVLRPGLPGEVGRAYRAGRNLAGPDAQRGAIPWADGLAERVPAARNS